MPTYTYKCTNNLCEKKDILLEVVQKMSDESLIFCPACDEETLSKVIVSSGGFRLKGPGWFKKGGY